MAFSLVGSGQFDRDEALAISACNGILLTLLSATPLLMLVLGVVPLSIKYGLVVGTGRRSGRLVAGAIAGQRALDHR